MTRRRIVLDSDLGSDADDVLCLALALASPEVELCAVTTIGNESLLRARITAKLLALAGREDIPVHAGCRVPLLGGNGFNWFGHEGEGVLEPTEEPRLSPLHAVDALRALLHAHDGLELVAVGPLTNIAAALILEPDLASRIASLTVMGGHIRSVRYGGHTFAPGVDYNLCSDAHASYVVLRSGIPIRLVTADVTLATWITPEDVAQIDALGTPFAAAIAESVRIWTPVQNRIFGRAGCRMDEDNAAFLHDPLALACCWDESFCRFEDLEIEPAIVDGVFRTLERAEPGEATRPMRCATDVEALRFRKYFVERISRLGAALPAAGSSAG